MTKAERQTYPCRESQLDGLNLDGPGIYGPIFQGSDFRPACLCRGLLSVIPIFPDTLFTDCSLAGADLSGADLYGAALVRLRLESCSPLKGADGHRPTWKELD